MEQKNKIKLSGLEKNISLKNYSTYKIGGRAKYFFSAKDKNDLKLAIEFSKEKNIPIFVLGLGSNILFSDKGFRGLVVKCEIFGIKFTDDGSLAIGAGEKISNINNFCLSNCLTGLEWSAGIPGTLGGALRGNAQAFGSKISDSVKEAEFFDCKKLTFGKIGKEQCLFSLKDSLFKKNKNLIITSATLRLKNGVKEDIKLAMEKNLKYRNERHPMDFPSAGSVFINPEKKIESKKLLAEFPELEKFNEKKFIPAAFLIEKCGLKGRKEGGAQISEKHANFIVNFKDAKAHQVLKLIDLAKREVKNKFGIALKEEIEIVGF